MLIGEKKEIIKERKPRNQVDNRVKPAARRRRSIAPHYM
jgi:hypothetical protein